MKWSTAVAALVLAVAATEHTTTAFGVVSHQRASFQSSSSSSRSFVSNKHSNFVVSSTSRSSSLQTSTLLNMSYSVGIVGATGAVGKEIKGCLEKRNFPVGQLRIFGSARSAGTVQETLYGPVTVELFDVAAARECDVVFLAVSGDFSLEHAEALAAGDDGCVVIDNSVRYVANESEWKRVCLYSVQSSHPT